MIIKPRRVIRTVSPVGVNVIDGGMVDAQEMDEENLILDDEELAYNINTAEDVETAERRRPVSSRKSS